MINIRNMTEQDIKRVQEVATTSWHTTYEGLIPLEVQDRFLEQAYSVERLKLRIVRSHFYVAEEDSVIFGFANFSPVKEDGKVELGAIYLLPEAQGKGVGTKLLKHGVSELQNVKEVYISVERDNQIGLNFYHSKGFVVVDEFEEEFGGAMLQTVRMKLSLE